MPPRDRPTVDSETSTSGVVLVDGATLRLEDVERVARQGAVARLAETARHQVEASRAAVVHVAQSGRPEYGVTTGVGSLSDRLIAPEQTRALQLNVLRSHAAGAGEPLATEVVRAALLLRANALASGYSGVRPVVIETLLALLNARIHPVVPSQGSLGASGDLAPLAHLALPLVGLGRVEMDGTIVEAGEALEARRIPPLQLEPKEAVALINGTQIMAALATLALLDAERLLESAISVAGLSACALGARRSPFDPRLHRVRPYPGQRAVAARIRALLDQVPEPERASGRVQDPYSIRCIPQVYGAVMDALRPLRGTLEIELNAATDNPLIFIEDGVETAEIVSGGNFHGHPLALGCDAAKIAVASLGAMIERRVALLVDGQDYGLPPFLVAEPGLNSGVMIAHYLTASLVAENRVLAHPSSVDSIPTSANVEDYNSMGATAARTFRQVVTNVETIVTVEALCAAQACDLAGRVPPAGSELRTLYDRIRDQVPFRPRDEHIVADDISALLGLLRTGGLAL
uniref:Histidine ammonia-lyase n=2 Tax=Thermorudis TaxID=1649508 RepID=A0A831T9L6_9BACT